MQIFEYKYLKKSYLNAVVDLQELILAKIQEPELYVPLSRKDFKNILATGKILGAFAGNELIATATVYYPNRLDNLGYDIGLAAAAAKLVFHLETINVHPLYRGYGLQYVLWKIILADMKNFSNCRFALATVSPNNRESLSNSFKTGLKIKGLKTKYGYSRYILFLDLNEKEKEKFPSIVKVSLLDQEKQKELLAKGYVGTAMIKKENDYLVFQKEKRSDRYEGRSF